MSSNGAKIGIGILALAAATVMTGGFGLAGAGAAAGAAGAGAGAGAAAGAAGAAAAGTAVGTGATAAGTAAAGAAAAGTAAAGTAAAGAGAGFAAGGMSAVSAAGLPMSTTAALQAGAGAGAAASGASAAGSAAASEGLFAGLLSSTKLRLGIAAGQLMATGYQSHQQNAAAQRAIAVQEENERVNRVNTELDLEFREGDNQNRLARALSEQSVLYNARGGAGTGAARSAVNRLVSEANRESSLINIAQGINAQGGNLGTVSRALQARRARDRSLGGAVGGLLDFGREVARA
jgi:hypothetical protein